MGITEIKQKIQDLISRAVSDNEQQKKLLNSLFRKLEDVKELETLDRLREYDGGKYLKAYLLYKSISRANYQMEHTNLTNFDEDAGKYLEAINSDIELLEKKEEATTPKQPTNEQLLIMISERMGTGEIKRELLGQDGNYLIIEDDQGIFKLDLYDGKLTPDPVARLLKKHGLNKEIETKN